MKYSCLFFLLLFAACGTGGSKKPQDQTNTGTSQETFQLHQIKNRSGESYYFYPGTNNRDSSGKLLVFFDPAGNGKFPLQKYRAMADSLGWSLAGCNSTRNGMSLPASMDAANALIEHLLTENKVDSLMLMGFSGGAKIALLSGVNHPRVSGIIFCGAVIPIDPNHFVKLVGIAGERDMNYTDLIEFDQYINNSGISHFLLGWDGAHEYPAPSILADALYMAETGDYALYQSRKASIDSRELAEEIRIKKELYEAMGNESLDWWDLKLNDLRKKSSVSRMDSRLLGFVSLACNSYTANAIKSGKTNQAAYFLHIYEKADPGNQDMLRMKQELKTLLTSPKMP